ncbi:MAG TPA: hypothetical protein VLC52_03570 [Anaerolineae bacterium]|nr:hypothetical protein [Anaerolineae bacterium]
MNASRDQVDNVQKAQKVQIHPVAARAGTFLLHYVEMILVMCIAGGGLNMLVFLAAARTGYPDLIERFPGLSILMIGILLAIPMTAWMRRRGHGWRPTVEMASTSVILAMLLVAAAALGWLPQTGMLVWMKRLACPIMLIPMVLRLDLYTGHHHADQHRAPAGHPGSEYVHPAG